MTLKYSLLLSLLEDFEKDQYKFFFVSLVKFPVKPFSSELLFTGRFCLLITDSISLLEIGLFKLSIYS